MELLKLLGTLGSYTLAVAITAIIGFLAFKVTQLVSILLLLKYCVTKLHDWLITKKTVINTIDKTVVFKMDNKIITYGDNDNADRFIKLLGRVSVGNSVYIHASDLDRLEKAIDLMEKK